MRTFYGALVASVALVLSGCLSDGHDPDGPTRSDQSTGIPEGPDPNAPAFRATWDPLNALLPYPNDITGFLLASASDPNFVSDGTLAVPETAFQLLVGVVNQLDGFSTTSSFSANFTGSVDPASVTPQSVFVVEVALDRATRAVVGLSDTTICKLGLAPQEVCPFPPTGNPFLVPGVDIDIGVTQAIDGSGQQVVIDPINALNGNRLNQLTPGTENGYLVIVTNGVTDTSGTPAAADTSYEQIKQGYLAGLIEIPDDPSSIDPGALTPEELLGLFTAAQLATAEALGIDVNSIVVTSSFTTLDTTTVLGATISTAQPLPSQLQPLVTPVDLPDPTGTIPGGIIPAGTPVTTDLVYGLLGIPDPTPGVMALYGGVLQDLPYYLKIPEDQNDASMIQEYWEAAEGANPLDSSSTTISKFNPFPVAKDPENPTVNVPILMAISLNQQGDPVIGGPLVIAGHGLTGDRTTLLALAEKWVAAGATVVSIDAPVHGIAAEEIDFANTSPEELAQIIAETPEALFRIPGVPERTFDIDLITGSTPGTPPDGVIDPSGAHWINLGSPLTTRDQWRQAAADYVSLILSAPGFDVTNDGQPDYGASTLHYEGISLSGIIGSMLVGTLGENSPLASATLGVAGGGLADLALGSFAFGPSIEAGLKAQGLTPNTTIYNDFFRDFGNALDAGDPLGYAENSVTPVHLITVQGDAVVPNSSSTRLINAFNAVELTTPGANDVSANGATRICFTQGSHGSQADPSASPAATVEMATETVSFGGSLGTVLPISDPSVIGSFEAGDCQAPDRPRENEPQ